MSKTSESKSRPLTQEELDGFHRHDFIEKVLNYLRKTGVGADGIPFTRIRDVKFIVCKSHYSLVEMRCVNSGAGKWEFSIAHQYHYSYRLSDVVKFLEDIYDTGAEIISLAGEIQLNVQHLASLENPE